MKTAPAVRGTVFLLSLPLAACTTPPMFPASFEKDVNPTIGFGVLQAHPDVYRGQVVHLAGRVLSVEQRKEGTFLVVHQLPIVKRPMA